MKLNFFNKDCNYGSDNDSENEAFYNNNTYENKFNISVNKKILENNFNNYDNDNDNDNDNEEINEEFKVKNKKFIFYLI